MKKILFESLNVNTLHEGVFIKDFKVKYPDENEVVTPDYREDAFFMLSEVYEALLDFDIRYTEKPKFGQMNFIFKDRNKEVYTVFFFQNDYTHEDIDGISSGIVVSKDKNFKGGTVIETFEELKDLLEDFNIYLY